MVDDESDLKTVLDDFHSWLKDEEKLKDNNHQFAVVTCGDWDLKQLLPNQLNYLSIPIPSYFQSWINLKIIFAEVTGIFPKNLPHMLSHLKLPTIGRLHSGIGINFYKSFFYYIIIYYSLQTIVGISLL